VGTVLENLLVVVLTLLTVLAFGALVRRLLGVRVGWIRTVLFALVAFLLAQALLTAMLPVDETDPVTVILFLALAVCCASMLAMVGVVLAEVIVPEGSLPGPIELWRSWRMRVARTRRYAQILRIAGRHGLGRFLRGQRHSGLESSLFRRDLARSLRRALDEGGITFVKLGQQLSARRDLLPEEFVHELTLLQDRAAPVPWPEVSAVLSSELGRPVEDMFVSVDPQPLAAASVAQVHAARLPDGDDVVIKVQRPEVAVVVERDLDVLVQLSGTLQARTRWGRSLGLPDLARGFAEALREELDFTTERDNLRAMAAVLSAGPARHVRVPVPYAPLSTRRVLVLQRLSGTPLASAESLLATLGAEHRHRIAAELLDTVLDQVLEHGLFHVDLHPGNVLVDDDGSVGLLDLGSVGRLDATTRHATGQLLAALGRADSLAATDALLELVERPDDVDERDLERALGALMVRYAAPGVTASAAAFPALFRLITTHRLAIPPPVAAVFRAFATLEATLVTIDPTFDLIAQARASGQDRMGAALSPRRLRQTAEDELVAVLPVLRRLPRRADRIAAALEHGRLNVNVSLFADARGRRLANDLLNRTLLTVLGATAGIMAVLLLGTQNSPQVTESVALFPLLAYGLLIIAVVLVLRVLIVIFRRDPV
jgi:ubiquinone biosynthesis protein